jgi:tetratricopeptide (TPR) repeat protein
MDSYGAGLTHAVTVGDAHIGIRIAIGRASLLRLRGEYDDACAEVRPALASARALADPDAIASGAHELGLSLYRLGRHDDALQCYREALGTNRRRDDRHRLLLDIGRALDALALMDAARDAWLAVFLSRKSDVATRLAAAVHLMGLSHETRDRAGFDLYRAVPRTRMTPRLLLAYFFELGEGLTVFRQRMESRHAYERAARVAEQLGLDAEAKRARSAMATQRARPARRPAPIVDLPILVTELLSEVKRLRQMPDGPVRLKSRTRVLAREPGMARRRLSAR